MLIGDVLKQMDDDRFIVKASSGPRYVVGCRSKLDKSILKSGSNKYFNKIIYKIKLIIQYLIKIGHRVALDMTTLTIMRPMPREGKFNYMFIN